MHVGHGLVRHEGDGGLLLFSAPGLWTPEPKWSCEERFDGIFWEFITRYTPH